MNSRHIWILLGSLLVSACNTVQKTEFDPTYLANIKERQPLKVPHREWIAENCYPKRELKNNKWIEVKVCNKQ